MDTSETYIKMCNCPEIQEQKPGGNEFSVGYENSNIWIEHEGHFFFKAETWLPRQDQLQELVGAVKPFSIPWISWLRHFVYEDWKIREGSLNHKTNEQLWLAFYMNQKHRKIWNGNKWIEK